MTGKYGNFTEEQFTEFKKKLHSKIHWLIIYKEFDDCDFFNEYFISTMKYINGLNDVLDNNPIIVDLLVTLQVAYNESIKKDFNFKIYRKYILSAHNIVDRL